jgi:DNA-binding NarL/FixJ family response regulator
VDVALPDGHGFDLVRNLRARCPHLKILVFSLHEEKVYVEQALRAEAIGSCRSSRCSGMALLPKRLPDA